MPGAEVFKGCVFALCGTFSMAEKELTGLIRQNGGACFTMVTPKTTHLVATPHEVAAKASKVLSAQQKGCPIVSEEFVHAALKTGSLPDASGYLLAASSSGSSSEVKKPKGWWKAKFVKVKAWTYGCKGEPHFPKDFTLVKHEILQWTDMITNHNKYYSIELHTADENGKKFFRLFTHYGRTDDLELNPEAGKKETRHYKDMEQTEAAWASIYEEKTEKKGYRKVDMASANIGSEKAKQLSGGSSSNDSKPTNSATTQTLTPSSFSAFGSSASSGGPSSNLHPLVEELVQYIYSEATSQLTATVSARITAKGIETPLGVLNLSSVERGEAILDEMEVLLAEGNLSGDRARELSSMFYTVIPHRIGRSKQDIEASVLKTLDAIEKKRELLQLMKDMMEVNERTGGGAGEGSTTTELDNKYKALRCEIRPLEKGGSEYQRIYDYVLHGAELPDEGNDDIEINNIFAVKREVEHLRWKEANADAIGNNKLLYHGSRISNWVGILSRGLLMPKSIETLGGKRTDYGLLGGGLYFGGQASTSAQYTSAGKKGTRFLLLHTVALGRIKQLTKITPGLTAPPAGYDSVQGMSRKHGVESDFKDDEFVVYSLGQQREEYLVEFRSKSKDPPFSTSSFAFGAASASFSSLSSSASGSFGMSPFSNFTAAPSPLSSLLPAVPSTTAASNPFGGTSFNLPSPSSSQKVTTPKKMARTPKKAPAKKRAALFNNSSNNSSSNSNNFNNVAQFHLPLPSPSSASTNIGVASTGGLVFGGKPTLPATPFMPLSSLPTDNQRVAQAFTKRQELSSSLAKLLLLVSVLHKDGRLTASQKAALKERALQEDTALYCALEVFELEHDFDDLVDTFCTLAG
ncbi:Poly [ADP-ribose] polymerase [Balamuthia mandrillaris]